MMTEDAKSVDAIVRRRMLNAEMRQMMISAHVTAADAEKARLKAKYDAKAIVSGIAKATIFQIYASVASDKKGGRSVESKRSRCRGRKGYSVEGIRKSGKKLRGKDRP